MNGVPLLHARTSDSFTVALLDLLNSDFELNATSNVLFPSINPHVFLEVIYFPLPVCSVSV